MLSIEKRAEFMTTCKSKESCQNLLDLLALDHRYLTICDALPNHKKIPIPEAAAETVRTAGVLRDGEGHDDDSAPDSSEHGDGAEADRGGTPPTPPGKKKSQDDDFRM
jgi:hypothetical protein